MIDRLKALPLILVIVLWGAGPLRAQTEEAPADIGLIARVEPSILVPKPVYGVKEGIVVVLNLKNPARVPVTLQEECLGSAPFRLERLEDRSVLKAGRLKKQAETALAPLSERKVEVDLRRLYRAMKRPGRYRLSWRCGEWASPHYEIVLAQPYDPEKDKVAVLTTDLGTIEIVFMPEQAPVHVRNFVELARQGYYDGVIFYEVIPGVQVFTGDRKGDGTGGWEHLLPPEIDESIFPGKGLVGAVRRESSMTSATQFFILLEASPAWAGKHTFFAYVREGQEVLDALSAVPITGGAGIGTFRPLELVRIQKVEIRGE